MNCMDQITVEGKHISLFQGDITEQSTDAIVNAANAQLVLGGGVAGAIRRKGGPSIQAECNDIGGTFVGGAVITGAGLLQAKHVIHAVGPRSGEGDEELKLRNATENSLKLMDEHGLHTITFPAISTGIFGFLVADCARIMIRTSIQYLQNHADTQITDIMFCLFDATTYSTFKDELDRQAQDLSNNGKT